MKQNYYSVFQLIFRFRWINNQRKWC